jgi:hypothetical protein
VANALRTMKKIKIRYFPKTLILVTPSALLLGTYFYYGYYSLAGMTIGLMGVLVGILTMTTFYVTIFDLKTRVYKDYISIFGLGFNHQKKGFRKIEKIVITREHHKHTVRFPGAEPYLVNWREFTAVLLHDNDRLELMTKKDKKTLIKEVKHIADFFKVGIEDNTVRQPYSIDLKKI